MEPAVDCTSMDSSPNSDERKTEVDGESDLRTAARVSIGTERNATGLTSAWNTENSEGRRESRKERRESREGGRAGRKEGRKGGGRTQP